MHSRLKPFISTSSTPVSLQIQSWKQSSQPPKTHIQIEALQEQEEWRNDLKKREERERAITSIKMIFTSTKMFNKKCCNLSTNYQVNFVSFGSNRLAPTSRFIPQVSRLRDCSREKALYLWYIKLWGTITKEINAAI